VQDHLDHLIPWEEGVVALLEHRPRFAAMGLDESAVENQGYDKVNAVLRAQTPRRGLSETRAALRAAHASMVRVLNRLSDADLFQPYSYYQPEARGENSGNPVINWIVGNSSEHYREHMGYMQGIVGPESSAQDKWRLART
jgi:hypothetical protein